MKYPNGPAHADAAGLGSPARAGLFAWAGGLLFAGALLYFLYAYLIAFGRPAPGGGWLPPAAANVLLFTVFALHHSLFARTPLKGWVHRTAGPAVERAIYVWMASLLFLGVCWLWLPVPGELYRPEGVGRLVGGAVQAAGVLLALLGSRALDVFDLAGIRQVASHSAPAHAPLVTSGVFGLVRHPIYLGWALLVFGAPHMTMTRAVFAVVSTLYVMVAIPWEERGLLDTFGPAYEEYRRTVRWRMLPFLY